MGIRNVWKKLDSVRRLVSLLELAVREGFLRNARNTQSLVVGIDASVWIVECQAVFYVPGLHTQAGENPELRTLFFRLAHLLRYPITVIFVFDGPERPDYKRSTVVKKKEHWVVKHFSEIIQDFHYKFHQAPGEAEAELAAFEKHGIIDFAITSDSDYFLFGGTRLIRSLHMKKQGDDDVEIYATKDFAESEGQKHLSRAGLLLIAVLHGADYDTVGLPGCGIVTATKLASTALATDLLAAAEAMTETQLDVYLAKWRHQLRKVLATNPRHNLPRHCTTLATKVPENFPNPHVVHLYANPVTSWSHGGIGPNLGDLSPQFPDTEKLAFHCERLFGWGRTIIDKFYSNIWPGYCIRTFSQLYNFSGTKSLLSPSSIHHICRQDTKFKSESAFESYLVEVWLPPLPITALSGARQALEDENALVKGGSITSINVWVPGPILQSAVPVLVDEFLHEAPPRHKKAKIHAAPYKPILPSSISGQPDRAVGSIFSSAVPINNQAQASSSHSTARRPHNIIEIDSSDEDNEDYSNYRHSIKTPTSVMMVDTSSTAQQTTGAPTSPPAGLPHEIVELHSEDDEYGRSTRRASTTFPLVLPTSPIELTDVDESDSEAANLSNRLFDDAMSISCSDEELVLPPGVAGTHIDLTLSSGEEENSVR
ncbi:uncharacterized protein LACBIDRAFT_314471 [Laccaria bicolor S238N-H82]|uniref:Predicted protein n=1 Tax=Laccaria bicolor (strain S238N-H82 / ATCC MYA-4686) TaxID=486041 RepID=B0DYM3_LACBS|nr:uncharacterized protein LACBIDRAFT_314471 [Laccaria bicolor S238N-H82]EDR00271.1 predicted protein [Laccaria bicolor S238N-H82]|eukprot:XP_001889023.1 predicted protein [Laccaria bicolor S238N-H82]